MIYKWGGRGLGISPQIVGEHIEKLEAEHGSVTRSLLVESARPEDSPVHSLFEWDDSKAAEQYRLHQATVCICSLKVVETDRNDAPLVVRAFVTADGNRQEARFVNIRSALSDEEKKDQIIAEAKRAAQIFIDKYSGIEELAAVIASMTAFLEE